MNLVQDPGSGLLLPSKLVDEKIALKKLIGDLVDTCVNSLNHMKEIYFLTLHMKFDARGTFTVSQPVATTQLPPFQSNSFVFFVSNQRGICELLWMVPAKKNKKDKLKPEFNQTGVAYLKAKGAMPS